MAREHIGPRRARRVALLLIALAIAACATGPAPAPDHADVAAIEALLAQQAQAWNRGDLHAFVAGYGESERMTFVGGDGTLVRGRDALEARYRKSYPAGKAGTLTFADLDVRRLSADCYVVVGKWFLARPPDDPHGVFTLILERGANGLEIVHDHSSDAK
jgi:uncharacterized protein (TIGR02246 family)